MVKEENNQDVEMASFLSPELNPTEMLWWDLKRAKHKLMRSNSNTLKQCCEERVGA